MTQIEIQFFWPLTEQIPLDLDFTESINFILQRMKESQQSVEINRNYVLSNSNTWAVNTNFHLEADRVTIGLDKPVPWYRKMLYKLLGMKVIEK